MIIDAGSAMKAGEEMEMKGVMYTWEYVQI